MIRVSRIVKSVVRILALGAVCAIAAGCGGKNTQTEEKAMQALERGEYGRAASLFDEAVEEGKDLQYVYRGKGIAHMGMMQYKEAADAFQSALDSESWIDRYRYGNDLVQDISRYLAVCYVRMAEYDKAVELYDKLIEEQGEDVSLLTDRGAAKAGAGRIEEAKQDFDKAINMDRTNYERILMIAQVLEQSGAPEIGRAYLQGVPELDERQIDPVLKGRILYFLGDYKGAEELLSKASDADEEAVLIRCKALLAMGDTNGALTVLESFGSSIDTSPSLLGLYGSVKMEQGKYEEGLDAFTRGAQAAEGTQEQQALLFDQIVVTEKMGDFAGARELLTAYLERFPGDQEAAREMKFLETR